MQRNLLEPSPHEVGDGELIGRDPRTIIPEEWRAAETMPFVGLRAIRAKCLDCAHTANEVRKCTATTCPLWPLRMGKQPLGFARNRDEQSQKTLSGASDVRRRVSTGQTTQPQQNGSQEAPHDET